MRPGVGDVCNGADDDCDGATDEEPTLVFYVDGDGDGFGLSGDPDDETLDPAVRPVRACAAPDGYAIEDGDCDDALAQAHPGANELCDPDDADEDCDGLSDEHGDGALTPAVNPITFYRDNDRDGFGIPGDVAVGCAPPPGAWADNPGDCNDGRASVNPDAGLTRVPDCPAFHAQGDMVFFVEARYCTDHWECVTEGGFCGELPGVPAIWDVDCSGDITVPIPPACTGDPASCGIFFSENGDPATCGLGATHYEAYECVAEGGSCVARGVGDPGPQPCR